MSEHVTTFGGGSFPGRERLTEATGRFGGEFGEVRTLEPRDADGTFQFLVAAKGRYPITRVVRHVCHHDQGTGICVDSVVEG